MKQNFFKVILLMVGITTVFVYYSCTKETPAAPETAQVQIQNDDALLQSNLSIALKKYADVSLNVSADVKQIQTDFPNFNWVEFTAKLEVTTTQAQVDAVFSEYGLNRYNLKANMAIAATQARIVNAALNNQAIISRETAEVILNSFITIRLGDVIPERINECQRKCGWKYGRDILVCATVGWIGGPVTEAVCLITASVRLYDCLDAC